MGMDAVADVKRKISRAKLPPPLIKPKFQPLIRFCQGLSITYAITFGSEPPKTHFPIVVYHCRNLFTVTCLRLTYIDNVTQAEKPTQESITTFGKNPATT